MTTSAGLSIDVQVAFDSFQLRVDQVFEAGTTTALFGQSGSGKTTLMRIIAGLERSATGSLKMGASVWQDTQQEVFVPPHQRSVGYVFQEGRLFEHLDVAGNLRFAERRAPQGGAGIGFDEAVEALDLSPLLGRRTSALSGGERQRVALGRALLTQPRWLLLDEPLSALDMRRRAEILPYLQSIPERFGVSTLYVSHALDEVVQVADRLLVLSDGQVAAAGRVTDVLTRLDLHPLTGRFEASVVLDATVARHDDEFALTYLDCGTHTLAVPRSNVAAGLDVKLRVRARDVSIALERPSGISIRNLLEGHISALVEEPDSAYAEVLVDVGNAHVRARLTRLSVHELGLHEGMQVVAMVKSVALERPSASRQTP